MQIKMGCPPSPEEIDAGRYGSMVDKSIEKFRTLKPQYERFFSFIDVLISNEACNSLQKKLTEIKKLNILSENIPGEMNTNFSGPDSSFYSWLGELCLMAHGNTEKMKALETSLCNARCLFYAFTKEYSPSEASNASEMAYQVAEYKKHREEDRGAWVAWLENEIGSGKIWLDTEDAARKEMAEYATKLISEEIQRTKRFTVEEMMLDCFLFGRDPEQFEFYRIFSGGKRANRE